MIKIDFAGKRKYWYSFSGTLILVGLFFIFTRGFNLGIDFVGGTLLDLKFHDQVTVTQVRDALKPHGLDNSQIQLAGDSSGMESGNNVMIRTLSLPDETRREVLGDLKSKVGEFDVLRTENVGATLGSELMMQAAIALVLSWLMIIGYLSYRFEFKFAVSAVLTLMYDALVVLSVFAILQKEIDATFVAALMTVVGYSVNDTVVIFDRIRENMKLHFRRGGSLAELVNTSVWETMTRSIYTVVTCLVTVIALYFFGGETTKNFALALIIGFMSGTYSSVCIAASLWITFKERFEKKRTPAGAKK